MYSEVIAKDPSGKAATATKRATKGGGVYARVVRVNRWGKHAVPSGSKYQRCFAVPGVRLPAQFKRVNTVDASATPQYVLCISFALFFLQRTLEYTFVTAIALC